jgi:hypothetical protein
MLNKHFMRVVTAIGVVATLFAISSQAHADKPISQSNAFGMRGQKGAQTTVIKPM